MIRHEILQRERGTRKVTKNLAGLKAEGKIGGARLGRASGF